MCLSRKYVDYLERSNEADFEQGRISYETYVRFTDIVDRCRDCELCENGQYGDILGECRLHFLRVFVSMKRDTERILAEKRKAGEAAKAEAAPAVAPGAQAPAPEAPAAVEVVEVVEVEKKSA